MQKFIIICFAIVTMDVRLLNKYAQEREKNKYPIDYIA